MTTIRFEAKPYKIGATTIVQLPKNASAKLPSRGTAMVKGIINGTPFQTALEPDGRGSHWFEIDDNLAKAAAVGAGENIELAIEPTKEWPEPKIPKDIAEALKADVPAHKQWQVITPMARWEWIRWIRATNRPETRQRHIDVARSKLRAGARRPCCFNSSMCTDFTVSKNGVLHEPA